MAAQRYRRLRIITVVFLLGIVLTSGVFILRYHKLGEASSLFHGGASKRSSRWARAFQANATGGAAAAPEVAGNGTQPAVAAALHNLWSLVQGRAEPAVRGQRARTSAASEQAVALDSATVSALTPESGKESRVPSFPADETGISGPHQQQPDQHNATAQAHHQPEAEQQTVTAQAATASSSSQAATEDSTSSSEQPVAGTAQLPAPPGGHASSAARSLPRVALLFLTRGALPYEGVWRAFLEGAARGAPGLAWRELFALHTHPAPGFEFPADSLFAGTEVAPRAQPEWGQHSLIEAERALLAAGLADPLAQRFVLLSESCIPLYPAAVVYGQLLGEARSRVHACADAQDPNDASRRMDYRMHPGMERKGLRRAHWRKSSQWFMLQRSHAQLVSNDTLINKIFKKECWVDKKNMAAGQPLRRFCVSDEHYIPTLLAFHAMEDQTDCKGAVTSTWWDGPYYHPKEFSSQEVSAELLPQLRKANEPQCNASAAITSARAGVAAAAASQAHADAVDAQHALRFAQRLLRGVGDELAGAELPAQGAAFTPTSTARGRHLTAADPQHTQQAVLYSAHCRRHLQGLGRAGRSRHSDRALPAAVGAASRVLQGSTEVDIAFLQLVTQSYLPMDTGCPLFARKFGAAAVVQVKQLSEGYL